MRGPLPGRRNRALLAARRESSLRKMGTPTVPPRPGVTRTDTDSDPGQALQPSTREGLEGRLGRYLLLEQVGSGGSGLVCRAYDPDLDRQVAIKVLNRVAGPSQDRAALRLKREAQAIARLDHPNVIDVFDVGEHEGEVFLAMEFVDGGSLKTWLAEDQSRAGPSQPPEAIIEAFIQAGRGLAAAHAKGIIHRDFKPSNVLIGADGVVRVADFGLARGIGEAPDDEPSPVDGDLRRTDGPTNADTDRSSSTSEWSNAQATDSEGKRSSNLVHDERVTATGAVLGTPAYMAPEQFTASAVDARADQYAFCLALGEALAGVSGREQVNAAFGPEPPTACAARLDLIARPIRAAVARGMADRPEDRFDGIDEVVSILEAPRQRRRWNRRAVAALVLSACFAAFGGYYFEHTRTRCAGLDAPFEAIWTPDRTEQLARRFVSQGGSTGGWEEVLRSIEQYRRAWSSARVDVCQATHNRQTQSARLLDLRMSCLDDGLQAMNAVLDLLQNESDVDAAGACEAILHLPNVDDCRSVTMPQRREPRPKTSAEQSELAALTREWRALEALHGAELWESGLARSTPALDRAQVLGFALPLSDAYAWHARFLAGNDRNAEAKAHWREAALHADAARDDERRLKAHLARIELDDGGIDTRIEVDADVAQARALMTRLDGGDRHRAAYLASLAKLGQRRGQLSECRTKATEALEVLERQPGARLVDRLDLAELLGSCLEALGLRRESARILREALEAASAAHGERHPRVGRLWWRLSRARDFAGDRAGARAAAERALEIATGTLGPEHSLTGRALHALSNVASREGKYEEALAYADRALEIYRKVYGPRSRWVGGMLTNRGLLLAWLGRKEPSYASHAASIELYTKELGPDHVETGAAIGRLASAYNDFGEHEKAVEMYRRALEIIRAADPLHARILDQARGLLIGLLALERPNEALEYVEIGLAVSAKRDETPFYTAWLEFLAAKVLWQSNKDQDRARQLALSAVARLDADGHNPDMARDVRKWLEKTR